MYKNVKRRIHGPVISSTVITTVAYIEKKKDLLKSARLIENRLMIGTLIRREILCESHR